MKQPARLPWCALLLGIFVASPAPVGAANAPAAVVSADLQKAADSALLRAWSQALAPASREHVHWSVQWSAPRGAALAPCPQGLAIGPMPTPRLGRVSVPVHCATQRGSVVAQVHATGPVWHLDRDRPSGHVLQRTDIKSTIAPLPHLQDLVPLESLLGRALKHNSTAGQTLHPAQLRPAVGMRRGDKVEIRAQGAGVEVSVQGVATRSGNLGDTVTVRNARNGRPVRGRLIAPGVLQAADEAPAGSVQIRAAESAD